MKIIKRNGNKENLSFDKVLYRLRKLVNDKNLGILKNIDPDVVSQQVIKNIYDGVKTSDLDEVAARIAISLSTEHPEYSQLASRIIISNMHKNTTECFSEGMEVLFNNKTEDGVSVPLISNDVMSIVRKNKEKINFAIDYNRDYMFDYFGYKTLERSYLLKIVSTDNKETKIIERPQHMWMRVALGLHKYDLEKAFETYELMSTFHFTHASPTLFNAGTPRPACSSCFLLGIEDSMLGIYKCISDCAMISKNSGGIGIHISNIRSKGSYIKGTNGKSDGIVKMLKVFNETARFANQGSKRNGSIAVYLEPFHEDIYEFLELRKNSGDETLRARDLFYALWINDAFMQAVEKDDDWYLMSEDSCPRLSDVYGEEFNKLYYKYVEEGKYRKVVKARDIWQRILISQIETGMPYMSYKDAVNIKCNQKNIGTVKSSNLCVAPETKILTSKGYYEIKDLENQEVEVWNGKQFSKTKVIKTGEDQTLMKIKFSNGTFLTCTPYHKFYIDNKVIEAKDLETSMKVKRIEFPIINNEEQDNMIAPYEYGLFCGDEIYFYEYFKEYKKNHNNENDININCKVPVNYSLNIKMKWLQGLFNSCNIKVTSNFVLLFIKNTCEEFNADLLLLFQTLGCNTVLYNHKLIIYISDMLLLSDIGLDCDKLNIMKNLNHEPTPVVSVLNVKYINRKDDTYCFNEPLEHAGVFNGVIAGNCNEITLVSNTKETAVCNICTFSLPKYLEKDDNNKRYNHEKLYKVVKIATKNMNNVIDYNFYPTPETKISNLRHRPIAMGIQGLANLLFEMRLPYESEEAKKLNKEIMETIQYAGWTASMELAKESSPYETYKGSPISEGLFQHNLWGVDDKDLSGRWDWEELRQNIQKYGVKNSMITALPPTASTSQILGNYESFEPQNSNMFMRSTLSGDFPIINKYLISDLINLKLWDSNMKERIISNSGSVQNISEIPDNIKQIYKTIWEIPQKHLIDMSVDRGIFVDQTQSLNIYMEKPTIAKLSSMHFYTWKQGCKTGLYYLRTKSASTAQKFTVTRSIQDKQKEDQNLACSIDNREDCTACSG